MCSVYSMRLLSTIQHGYTRIKTCRFLFVPYRIVTTLRPRFRWTLAPLRRPRFGNPRCARTQANPSRSRTSRWPLPRPMKSGSRSFSTYPSPAFRSRIGVVLGWVVLCWVGCSRLGGLRWLMKMEAERADLAISAASSCCSRFFSSSFYGLHPALPLLGGLTNFRLDRTTPA